MKILSFSLIKHRSVSTNHTKIIATVIDTGFFVLFFFFVFFHKTKQLHKTFPLTSNSIQSYSCMAPANKCKLLITQLQPLQKGTIDILFKNNRIIKHAKKNLELMNLILFHCFRLSVTMVSNCC